MKRKKRVSINPGHTIQDPTRLWEPPPEKGDGVQLSGRVSGLRKRAIQEAVQSGLFRFKTENDLVRTAVGWFLDDKISLYVVDGKFDPSLRTVSGLRRMSADTRESSDVRSSIMDVMRTVRVMTKNRLFGRVHRYLEDVIQRFSELSDREWAEEAMEQLREVPTLRETVANIEKEREAQ